MLHAGAQPGVQITRGREHHLFHEPAPQGAAHAIEIHNRPQPRDQIDVIRQQIDMGVIAVHRIALGEPRQPWVLRAGGLKERLGIGGELRRIDRQGRQFGSGHQFSPDANYYPASL